MDQGIPKNARKIQVYSMENEHLEPKVMEVDGSA